MANWLNTQRIEALSYICGYCGAYVASYEGYVQHTNMVISGHIYICHNCENPTYKSRKGGIVPSPTFGNTVEHIPIKEVEDLYNEARNCMRANASTAAILCCRKLLMNIAVSKGAKEGISFIQYVEFISDKGFVPPDAKEWIDHIRKKGNEATHEIAIMRREDAEELITFIEMVLKIVYEFPTKIKNRAKELAPLPGTGSEVQSPIRLPSGI